MQISADEVSQNFASLGIPSKSDNYSLLTEESGIKATAQNLQNIMFKSGMIKQKDSLKNFVSNACIRKTVAQ